MLRGLVPSMVVRPKISTPPMAVMPCAPPNHPESQSDRNSSRMISPNPKVTMAR